MGGEAVRPARDRERRRHLRRACARVRRARCAGGDHLRRRQDVEEAVPLRCSDRVARGIAEWRVTLGARLGRRPQRHPDGFQISGVAVAVDEQYMRIRRSLERKLGVEEASYLMDRPAGGWSELVTNETLDLKFEA